jgi:NADH-quinone oxidoreductase subunit A
MFLLHEYFGLFFFLFFIILISSLIIILSHIFALNNPGFEKLAVYECGFDAFEDARNTFEVRFYLVAILFLIFDLELSFLFPWAVSLSKITSFGFWTMIVFLIILTVGFLYEWKKGALDWS